jgi:hypothetical protein
MYQKVLAIFSFGKGIKSLAMILLPEVSQVWLPLNAL